MGNLRTKIIAWSFVPTLIILSAVAWFTFYSYQKVIGDLALKQDQELLRAKSYQVYQMIGAVVNRPLIPVMLEIDLDHAEPIQVRAQKIIDRAKYLDIFDGGVYFLDRQGKVVVTWPDQPDVLSQDWSSSIYFNYVKEHEGKAAFTEILPAGPGGKDVTCSVLSLFDQNQAFAGASYYCFWVYPGAANAYVTALAGLNLGPDVYLLDSNQRILYTSDTVLIGKELDKKAYLQQLIDRQELAGRYKKGSDDLVISYAPVFAGSEGLWLWVLVKEEKWAEIMRPSLAYRQLMLILLALGVIVPVIVVAFGVRRITDPIQKLIHASQRVAGGQFDHEISIHTGDEIEALADQFNQMSAELNESYSTLEKKIADRTKELAILNSIVAVASRSLNIPEILEDALGRTKEQMSLAAGAAFRLKVDPPGIDLIANHAFEDATAVDLAGFYLRSLEDGSAGDPPLVTTWEIDHFPPGDLKDRVVLAGHYTLAFVPLSAKERILGLFILAKPGRGVFSPEEMALLGSVGQQVGVAMENAHLYEQAEQVAITAERNRLAREFHDAVTQSLFSASLIADVLPRIWKRDPEEGQQSLEELRQLTRGALAEMRALLLEMRPESLDRSDLKALVTQLTEAFMGRVRVPVSLEAEGHGELSTEVKIAFYRVAQEALNNIAKHAGARQVEIHLDYHPEGVRLAIQDDGLGFDLASIPPGHMGMTIMSERAATIGATLTLDSQVGKGTKIEMVWKAARKDESDERHSNDPSDAG